MADKEENPKLEALLRRWGAHEAAGHAAVGPLAMRHGDAATPAKELALGAQGRPRFTWTGFAARWAPLAAAAMFIIASGVIVWDYRQKMGTYEAQLKAANRTQSRLKAQAQDARQSLQKVVGEIAEIKDAAKDASAAKDVLVAKTEKELGGLQARYDETAAKLLAANDRVETDSKEIARLKAAMNDKSGMPDLPAQLAQARQDLERSQADAKAARSQLADASADLGTLRQQAKKSQDDYQRRLDAAFAAQTASLDRLGAGYLKAASPGQNALVARQQASKRLMLVDRIAKLRPQVKSPQTRILMDQIEAALTRLEMLDASNSSSWQSFATTVGQELPARLDHALFEGGVDQRVLALLLDARIVIGGLGNVG
jgi:chromosome segregation ATPase